MKLINKTEIWSTIHSSQQFDIDLAGGLGVKATAFLTVEPIKCTLINTKAATFEISEVELEYTIGGKICKYVGFKELYTKLFGDTALTQLENEIDGLIVERMKDIKVLGYTPVENLSLQKIRSIIVEKIQTEAAEWGGMLYTSSHTILHLVREYNRKNSADIIQIKQSNRVPPSWRVLNNNVEWWAKRENKPTTNYICLSVTSELGQLRGEGRCL